MPAGPTAGRADGQRQSQLWGLSVRGPGAQPRSLALPPLQEPWAPSRAPADPLTWAQGTRSRRARGSDLPASLGGDANEQPWELGWEERCTIIHTYLSSILLGGKREFVGCLLGQSFQKVSS